MVGLLLRWGLSRKNQKRGRNQGPERVFKFKLGKPRSFYKCKEQVQDESGPKLRAGASGRSEMWGSPRQLPGVFLDSQQWTLLAVYGGGWTEWAESGASTLHFPWLRPELFPEQR